MPKTPQTSVLTMDGRALLKASLHLPLCSGHADEAIARGFGFRTHAALRSTIRRGEPVLIAAFNGEAMLARATALGGDAFDPWKARRDWADTQDWVSYAMECAACPLSVCDSCGGSYRSLDRNFMSWPFGAASICVCSDCARENALSVKGVHYAVKVRCFTLDEVRRRTLFEWDDASDRYADLGGDRILIGLDGQKMSFRCWLDAHHFVPADGAWVREAMLRASGSCGWCRLPYDFDKAFPEVGDLNQVAPLSSWQLVEGDAVAFPPLPIVWEATFPETPAEEEELEWLNSRLASTLAAAGIGTLPRTASPREAAV